MALDAEDVAKVPMLEVFISKHILRDVNLNPPGSILQRGEARFAHHALEHHAASDLCRRNHLFQFLLGALAKAAMQVGGEMLSTEIIGVRDSTTRRPARRSPT